MLYLLIAVDVDFVLKFVQACQHRCRGCVERDLAHSQVPVPVISSTAVHLWHRGFTIGGGGVVPAHALLPNVGIFDFVRNGDRELGIAQPYWRQGLFRTKLLLCYCTKGAKQPNQFHLVLGSPFNYYCGATLADRILFLLFPSAGLCASRVKIKLLHNIDYCSTTCIHLTY